MRRRFVHSAMSWTAAALGIAAASYRARVAWAWYRYGHIKPSGSPLGRDSLLDRFIPNCEVAERHAVRIAAPADVVFSTACELRLEESPMIRAIFKGRELLLHSKPNKEAAGRGLAEQARQWGWGLLAEIPGREIVFGAVTQPWMANPVFRALPPSEFAGFGEPGFVKIAWTLRADPTGAGRSVAITETRAIATDAVARAKFRSYWAFLSPGIVLIRKIALRRLKAEAERRVREAALPEDAVRQSL